MNRLCELDVILSLFRLTSEGLVVRTHLRPLFVLFRGMLRS
jgi:hypothetical protein